MPSSILTDLQKRILSAFASNHFIRDKFYFSGGTVLAEYYLQHRLSEDLDFFTVDQIDYDQVNTLIQPSLKKYGLTSFDYQEIASSKVYFFQKGKQEIVKTDFNFYPFPRVKKGRIVNGLEIDSLQDITINKFNTLMTRSKVRDFIDFYYIQQEKHYPLKLLLKDTLTKFDWKVDLLYLASCLTKFDDLKDYPRMLKPLDIPKISLYYWELADSLKEQVTK